jgi:hypothetical protein
MCRRRKTYVSQNILGKVNWLCCCSSHKQPYQGGVNKHRENQATEAARVELVVGRISIIYCGEGRICAISSNQEHLQM